MRGLLELFHFLQKMSQELCAFEAWVKSVLRNSKAFRLHLKILMKTINNNHSIMHIQLHHLMMTHTRKEKKAQTNEQVQCLTKIFPHPTPFPHQNVNYVMYVNPNLIIRQSLLITLIQ